MRSEASARPPVRVLVVDDEAVFRETLAKLLRRRGYEVLLAGGGEQALAILSAGTVEVVVLDLKMPGLGGLETLQQIARLRPETRVIMLTGHGTVEAGLEALEAAAYDFLLKPVAPEQLVEVIENAARHEA